VGCTIRTENVTEVDLGSTPFKVVSGQGSWTADAVIISTGATARWLGLSSEQTLLGRGVSACATCDGFFFRNKDVVVVGGGDTAMEEALYLAKICASVTVVHRRESLRASRIMQERALQHPKLRFIWNAVVDEIVGETKVEAIRVRNVVSGEVRDVACDGVFVAIGHQPNTALFDSWLKTDENGYLKTQPGSTRTNVPGVFAAGDVQDHVYRQAVTAAGTGCMAALDAERWLAARSAGVPVA
jgi:thioredoxin reductase (NADPH)